MKQSVFARRLGGLALATALLFIFQNCAPLGTVNSDPNGESASRPDYGDPSQLEEIPPYVEPTPGAANPSPDPTPSPTPDPGAPAPTPKPVSKIFLVDDYGATKNGSTDSTAGVRAAIAAAKASGEGAEVRFSAGSYRLDCAGSGATSCFTLHGVRKLAVRGQGASTKLLISNPMTGVFDVAQSEDVEIKGLNIDYSSLPFTQGTIQAVSAGWIDVQIDAGYPWLEAPLFSVAELAKTFGMVFSPGTTSMKGSSSNYYFIASASHQGSGRYRLTITSGTSGVAVGDRFAVSNRSQNLLVFFENKNITIKDLTFYSGPGPGSIWVRNTGRIHIEGFNIRRKPGTNRLISAGADAIHMLDNPAFLNIRNCYFDGMADDILNTRSSYFTVTQINGHQIKMKNSLAVVAPATRDLIKPGYRVQFINPQTQKPRGAVKVHSVTVEADQSMTTLNLEGPVPGWAVGDVLFVAELAGLHAVVRHNTFGGFRGIARLRTPGAIFADNTFLDGRNAQLFIRADISPNWIEGPSLESSLDGIYQFGNVIHGGGLYYDTVDGKRVAPGASMRDLAQHSAVYDPVFYRRLYPDLAGMSEEGLKNHWVDHGIREGRYGSSRFHFNEYLSLHPDLEVFRHVPQSAAGHFVMDGINEGRLATVRTNPMVYDFVSYRTINWDLASWPKHELDVHWIKHGIDEARQGNSLFWSRTYLARYVELGAWLGQNPGRAIDHYVLSGWLQGLSGKP